MAAQTRVVKLIENYIYPTFQLYAVMANRKISPKEGLRLAALTVMEWLRQRMGERIPPELEQPAPDQYKTAGDHCLPSLHLNRGYLIDILSLPEQGIWSLQITEPDLGSEPGNKDQLRAPVAGRVIETNIGFHIRDKVLECGFQTLISDPEGTREKADVYRLAVVRRLMENPEFGLKQILPLSGAVPRLRTASELSKAAELSLAPENQLPVVIFTCRPSKIAKADDAFQRFAAPKVLNWDKVELNPDDFAAVPAFARDLQPELPVPPVLEEAPPYDVSEVAEKLKGFCRVYFAETALLAPLSELAGKKVCPGDIVALEPARFGAKRTVFAYPGRRTEQQSRLDELLRWGYTYPREKPCDFGEVRFLSAARETLFDTNSELIRTVQDSSEKWEQTLQRMEQEHLAELRKKERECSNLRAQVERLKVYQARIEAEKDALNRLMAEDRKNYEHRLTARDEEVAYLRRKLTQPKEHSAVVNWARSTFSDRLFLHRRTETLLEKRSAQGVNIGLICDALDFLATDYWENRYAQLPTDEMNLRCSEKYGRRFDVSRVGTLTIGYTPLEYKVKYLMTGTAKAREYPLDWHLGVGSDPENLLRIYFFHDDTARKIVIGSMPEHLTAVQIQ